MPFSVPRPVERIDVTVEATPEFVDKAKPELTPEPQPLAAAVTVAPVTVAPEIGLRETLEQAQRARAATNRYRRLAKQAAVVWREAVQPALATKAGRMGLAAAGSLIVCLVLIHYSRVYLGETLSSALQPVRERSYFALGDSFAADPKAWTNPGVLVTRPDGLVELGEGLTLYRPSLSRTDYEFAFEGQIRRAALNWAVRASDPKNYFAFKLTRQGKGRDKRSVLIRYAVAQGEPSERHVAEIPFDLEDNRAYRVTVDVNGGRITTMIDNRGVDSYSDPRPKPGGVGFFTEQGEAGLIGSLSVSGNDDPTGRTIYWFKGFYLFLSSKL